MSKSTRFVRRRGAVVVALALAMLAASAAASARPAETSPGGCAPSLSQPFMRWLDPGSYFLAPGGSFESGAGGWTLAGGAAVGTGNDPWHTAGSSDSHALNLPGGATATSPAACIGLLDPTLRFFVRNSAPLGLGVLVVTAEVRAGDADVVLPVGLVGAGAGFSPSLPLPLLVNLLTPLGSGTGDVTLRFQALGGNWQLDDVYIDPFRVS